MKAFIAVVEQDGYSSAARKLGRSKALISKYVKELEDDLGALLINRSTRNLSLTEAGQTYYKSCVEIISKIDNARELVRGSGAELTGNLKVTAPRSLGGSESMLPLIEFAKAYPEVKLDIDLSDNLVDLVEDGFDVAIRVGRLPDSSLIAKKLLDNRIVYCASPSFIEKNGNPNHPKDLINYPCIVDTNWQGRNNWLFKDKEGAEFSVAVNSVLDANDPEICKRAALAGFGIAMVPEFSIVNELKKGSLELLLEDYLIEGSAFYAVYAHRRHVSAKVRVFVDFMANWFKQIK